MTKQNGVLFLYVCLLFSFLWAGRPCILFFALFSFCCPLLFRLFGLLCFVCFRFGDFWVVFLLCFLGLLSV